MNTTQHFPLDLIRANLALQAELAALVQDSLQQWATLGQRVIGEGIAESQTELTRLMATQDWQTLATLPVDGFWRQLQQCFGDGQALADLGVQMQTRFATGLQTAIARWQQATADAFGAALPGAMASESPWADLARGWERLLASLGELSVPRA